MRILVETGRGPALSADLPGPLLTIPHGLRVVSTGPTTTRLALDPSLSATGSNPDVLVGSIPLVSWDARHHRYVIEHITIPPPPPISDADVNSMWLDVVAAESAQPRAVLDQGRGAGQAALLSHGIRVDALGGAIASAQRLLSAWPSEEQGEVVWRPPEIPGVRIDGRATDRAAGRFAGQARPDGRLVPARVAGRRVGAVPWTSRTLAASALALRSAISELPSFDAAASGPATMILERVAMAAQPGTNGVDPPVSAWPRAAAQALRALLSALVQLRAAGTGHDSVPLTDLWRLYEAWVALEVFRELAARFGRGTKAGKVHRWPGPDYAVTMTTQCTVGDAAIAMPPAHWRHPVRSVSSDLIPDVMVWVQGRRGRRLIIVETKQRTMGTAMDAGAIAEAASKYLWGIRDAADDDVFAVEHVLVVSSAWIDKAMNASAARISSSWHLPGRGDGALSGRLHAALTESLSVVR